MYTIIEIANTHGGRIDYLISLIEEFKDIKENIGIKFQPFKYNEIALSDFEWYSVYEKLFFSKNEWSQIIKKAKATKDIWLDIFDLYGIEILNDNLSNIEGIKFQTSILENYSVLEELKEINLTGKKLIINIAGREMEDIASKIAYFEDNFDFTEIFLEVGFQAFPTSLIDSGLSKIKILKEKFKKKIVFADHVDGKNINAKILPILALQAGANIIEKHVMHSSLQTEFDHYSSIKVDDFKDLIKITEEYENIDNQPFINKKEEEYFNKTIQIPVFKRDTKKGEIVSLSDFNFKRTDLKGIDNNQLKNTIVNGNIILNKDKTKDSLIQVNDFKKIKIACIIAARLKSTRLKEKAKLKIGNELTSLELCIKNTLAIKNVDETILATSTTEQDADLINYKYDEKVLFHTGDPEDVIQRYLDVIRKNNIDVFIRITGDMPFVSKEITEYLLNSHLLSGADYTAAKEFSVGTSVEIINSIALEKVKSYFTSANYSEYMTWYFQNNSEHFKLNLVDLPKKWIRDYRLTIDYPEDLEMFNHIQSHFDKNNVVFNIKNMFAYLDNNQDVVNINRHLTLKYKTDKVLIDNLNRYTKIKL